MPEKLRESFGVNNSQPFYARHGLACLIGLACLQAALYLGLLGLSRQFQLSVEETTRPILAVLALLALLFVSYLGSLWLVIRLPSTKGLVGGLFAFAVLIRIIMLFSQPIQEVDLYRYIWDGSVSNQGVSPYRYPPSTVMGTFNARIDDNDIGDRDLAKLVSQIQSKPGLRDVLSHVHFAEVPTVYPPVSQVVFRISDFLTPSRADITLRLRVMKFVIVLFDIGVMFFLWLLLRSVDFHPGWSIAYGWSPLVIKEFANSGHLDSIAVFLMMAALVVLVSQFKKQWLSVGGSAALLASAFGAKLFPIVLAPLFAVFVWRQIGLKWAAIWCVVFVMTAGFVMLPLMRSHEVPQQAEIANPSEDELRGFKLFLSRWEINDVIFMAVQENIRPDGAVANQPKLWFVVTPNRFRVSVTNSLSTWFAGDVERTPFLATRLFLTMVFGGIVLLRLYRTWNDESTLLESAFLIVAWFWLLLPTQNPWYWTWALPLVAFTRNRSWLWLSGLALIYYSRFWFQYHFESIGDWGGYQGVLIFDFIVVWFEFLPFFVLLLGSWVWPRKTV